MLSDLQFPPRGKVGDGAFTVASPRRQAAQRTGLDAEAIWEWGVIERVSTGLLGTRVGLQPVATQMLRVAEHIAP